MQIIYSLQGNSFTRNDLARQYKLKEILCMNKKEIYIKHIKYFILVKFTCDVMMPLKLIIIFLYVV